MPFPTPTTSTPSTPTTVNKQTDLLVLTCASGKQASAILPLVSTQWRRLRLICHTATSATRLRTQYPNAEVIATDLGKPGEAGRVVEGASVVYHVEPPFAHRQAVMGFAMVDAAVEEGRKEGGVFRHFVYASVLNPMLRKMIHHDQRLQVEEYLLESPLPYTILQPTHFMFLFPLRPLLASPNPVYTANWNPHIPFSFLSLGDLGEVAAKVLAEREPHFNASYPLVSDGPLTYAQICDMVSAEIGKEVGLRQMSYEESVRGFLTRIFGKVDGVDAESVDATERILLYYNRRGLVGSSNVCRWLLGREPTGWAEWMREEIKVIRKEQQGSVD